MQRLLMCSVLGVAAFATASRSFESSAALAVPAHGTDVFWHTDLAAANAEAVESGKPLLVVFR